MSTLKLIKAAPKNSFESLGLDRGNYGYRIEIDGGDLVHFRTPGSGAIWASKLVVEGVLPDPVFRAEGIEDTAFGCIVDYIDSLDTVPYENMGGYEELADDVSKLLKEIVADLDTTYTKQNLRPAFACHYTLAPEDATQIPATVRITPTVRGSFNVKPATIKDVDYKETPIGQ